ncbi:MAG: DUF6261 family protein [Tannerellaceae bacterium]|jgi:hypothetical protein|nr:DUF6261 family protein [Tannerellaceae bacterium]
MNRIDKCARLTRHLRNSEHFEFYEEIFEFVEKHKSALGNMLGLWSAFAGVFKKEDRIYKHNRRVAETRLVMEADAKRLNAWMALKRGMEMASYKDDDAQRTAAKTLAFVLDNYRKIRTAPLVEASALIFNLAQDLRRPVYAASVETLGLTEAVNTLEACNEAFKALYEAREMETERAIMQGNMQYIRPLVDKAFAAFTEALNVFCVISSLEGKTAEAAALNAIINRINAAILQYKTIYARRSRGASPEESPAL